MKAEHLNSNIELPLLVGSLSNACLGLAMIINSQWTLTQLFVSRIFDIAYPLASFLGVAYLTIACQGLLAFVAPEPNSFQRKKDALLVQSMFFIAKAFVNFKCYYPLLGPSMAGFNLVSGEGRLFLWMAIVDLLLSLWSFITYFGYSQPVMTKTRPSPGASQ